MEHVFPEIPTADMIAAMTPEEKEAARVQLETLMQTNAQTYIDAEAQRVEAQAKCDAAYDAFKAANKILFDDLLTVKVKAQDAHDFLQDAAVARRQLTGDVTWKAFQAAKTWKPEYDHHAMFLWALFDAPGEVRQKLLKLDTKAADSLITSRIDERGIPKQYEGCSAFPALARPVYTGKVLSKELDAFIPPRPAPEAEPAKLIEPVGGVFSIQITDPIRILTQDEVRQAIADPMPPLMEDMGGLAMMAAKRTDETPTPVDPIPAVMIDDDEEAYLGASTLAKLRTAAMEADDNAADSDKVPF